MSDLSSVTFRWLDLLESDFDKAYVQLDLALGEIEKEFEESELIYLAKRKLTIMSSTYAQLLHKAQTIFQNNLKLEAELVHLRQDLINAQAVRDTAEVELNRLMVEMHDAKLKLLELQRPGGTLSPTTEKIRQNLREEVERRREATLPNFIPPRALDQMGEENKALRNELASIQGELYGSRLATKYLDKELAGRIQQIQLLGRGMDHTDQEKVWNQLESEIQLHRHKTVARACRNKTSSPGAGAVASPPRPTGGGGDAPGHSPHPPRTPNRDPQPLRAGRETRCVVIEKDREEGLGMSVTGGYEHGIPIMISEVHAGGPAARTGQLTVGDAILSVNGIDISKCLHSEGVEVLLKQSGRVTLEVQFISEEDTDSEFDPGDTNPANFRYKLFDDEVISVNDSHRNLFIPNGDDISSVQSRQSSDNVSSPRRKPERSSGPPVIPGSAQLLRGSLSDEDTSIGRSRTETLPSPSKSLPASFPLVEDELIAPAAEEVASDEEDGGPSFEALAMSVDALASSLGALTASIDADAEDMPAVAVQGGDRPRFLPEEDSLEELR